MGRVSPEGSTEVGGAGVTFLTRLNPRSGLVQFFTSGSGNEKGRC